MSGYQAGIYWVRLSGQAVSIVKEYKSPLFTEYYLLPYRRYTSSALGDNFIKQVSSTPTFFLFPLFLHKEKITFDSFS